MHGSDFNSLYKEIPKEVLPNEYGGSGGTVQEIAGKDILLPSKEQNK